MCMCAHMQEVCRWLQEGAREEISELEELKRQKEVCHVPRW